MLVGQTLNSQIVNQEEAAGIAGIIFMHSAGLADTKGIEFGDSQKLSDSVGNPLLYIFTLSKGGFVILSGDRRTYPVLGFSAKQDSEITGYVSSDPSAWPPAFSEWINLRLEEIDWIRKNNLQPTPYINEMWDKLEKGYDPGFTDSKSVSPLLKTTWNQGCGYNSLCPADPKGPCGRVVTGCVATAMAQVIRYNHHPVNGTGSRCYTSAYGQLCADFSTANYNYSLMPDNSGNAEVAKLMYHCGVAVSMSYGPYGSSAYSSSVAHAMRTWFDYTNGLILSKNSYAEEAWTNILKNELHSKRPVYYSGFGTGGHAFVVDGYKPTNHFHVNWGWGGSCNGYFYLSALNPGSMNFTSGQQGIIGMIPSAGFTGLDFSSAAALPCKTPVNGNISTGNDYVNYYKNLWPATPGKELVYTFTTTLPGRIRIKITDQSASVYTFLLNRQHKDSVVVYGTNGLIADNTMPGKYYVVVEGFAASEPTFKIEVICPTPDPDFEIETASVSPRYVQSLQPNVSLNSRVKNIGNGDAPASLMEYFLSTDNKFDEGKDIFLGSKAIPSINAGHTAGISSVITMPGGLAPGYYYVVFVADRENKVPEADNDNCYAAYVTIPEPGQLNCSTAIALSDGVWHRGNTLAAGTNKIDNYAMGQGLTGPEVIHSFTPLYNGKVTVTFVEKSPGMLYAMVLPVCNEKTSETGIRIFNKLDTIGVSEFYGTAGTEYYIVVDGEKGAYGDYALKVDLPSECPVINLEKSGKTDLCDGDRWPYFWTFWGYSSYQWYHNGVPVPGATNSGYTPSAPGNYHLVVTENGCPGSSETIVVRMDPTPDTARIISRGDTVFCRGGSVTLELQYSVTYPVNWALNGKILPGATNSHYTASTDGKYSVFTINGACAVESKNKVTVKTHNLPLMEGERIPLPSGKIIFHYPFTADNNDDSGETSMLQGWDYEPANDRFGGFWQARHLTGRNQIMYSSVWDSIPAEFSLGIWIKTLSDSGGVVAGFYDSPWKPELSEAILFMSADGKLHFWLSNGGTPVQISTTKSYNDGKWHCIVIRHGLKAFLDVDNGTEKIESASTVVKKIFKGYWTVGGSYIPAGVLQGPPSVYWKGTFDDLILLKEDNALLISYMAENPLLKIITLPEKICESGCVSFDIPFTEYGIEYRVRNNSSWYTSPGMGNGGRLILEGLSEINSESEFLIIARNPFTGCERVSAVRMKGVDICTVLPDTDSPGTVKVFPVPADYAVWFESGEPLREITIFDNYGRKITHLSGASVSGNLTCVSVVSWAPGLYYYRAILNSGQAFTGKIIVR